MNDYEPSTAQLRSLWGLVPESRGFISIARMKGFDRWLDAHDAEVSRRSVESLITGGVTFDPDRDGA